MEATWTKDGKTTDLVRRRFYAHAEAPPTVRAHDVHPAPRTFTPAKGAPFVVDAKTTIRAAPELAEAGRLLVEELENRRTPAALIAAYAFDEGAGDAVTDASGLGNHGTITGPTWTPSGRFGGALTFDGVNDLITIADADSLDLTTGMTLEAWVNPSAVTRKWRDVIYKGNDIYFLEATSTNSSRPGAAASRNAAVSASGASMVAKPAGRSARCLAIRACISASNASAVATTVTLCAASARSQVCARRSAWRDLPLRWPPTMR